MNRFHWWGLASCLLSLPACSSNAIESNPEGPPGPVEGREERLVTAPTAALTPVIASNNQLGWSIYGAARAEGENLFFSPFSLSVALGMTYAGARGETADELQQLLAAEPGAAHHEGLGALSLDLGGEHPGRGYQLFTANRMYGDEGTRWSDDLTGLLSETYGAPLESLAFSSDPEAARSTVNQWVSEQTRERVSDLIKEGDFDSLTRFALVNACYFSATWADSFNPKDTYDGTFQLEDGSTAPVSMMTLKAKLRASSDDTVSVVELDYTDRELSFVLILPEVAGGLAAVEPEFDQAKLDALLASTTSVDGIVALPKLELRAELPLDTILQGLGVQSAFDAARADFSGMLAEPNGPGELFLTKTRHQTYLRIDEEGTEAAASTAVVGGTRSVPPSFIADRPFAFVIRDKLTGTVLFTGRVADPR